RHLLGGLGRTLVPRRTLAFPGRALLALGATLGSLTAAVGLALARRLVAVGHGFVSRLSLVLDHLAGALGETHLAAVGEHLEADAGRLAVLGILERQVGEVDGGLLGDDAALLLCGLALVSQHHVDAAHERPVLLGHDLEHLTLLALVATGEHDHLVALLDLGGTHHSTSGARLTIFMWFLALSSRV